jgi:hypothetical protein
MPKLPCVLCIALALFALPGCGEPRPQFVEFEGTVKLNGEPLEKIHVEFWPEVNGPKSVGLTDQQGKFVLSTMEEPKRNGAVVGKHKVVLQDISIISDKARGRDAENVDLTEGRKPRIMEVYSNAVNSPLTVEVSKDKRTIEFDVKAYAGK